MRSILIALSVLACAAASAGEVYKWKDKDGRVHYGDKPKTGEAQSVIVDSSKDDAADPAAAGAAQAAAARAAECKTKKTQLDAWRRAPTMSEVDNLGRTREYTPAERLQFLDITQKKVDELCAPPPPPSGSAGTFPPPEEKYTPVEPPPEEPASDRPG